MGRRGVPPKPTNVRVLHGDRKDRVNNSEPVPTSGRVEPPDWLPGLALQVWHHYAPDLVSKGVLTSWDVETFAAFCDAVARRRRAAEKLTEEGEVIEAPVFNKNGDVTGHRVAKNPWTLVLNEADGQVQRYGARFGMTPSDRSQLKIGDGGRGAKGDDLLSG